MRVAFHTHAGHQPTLPPEYVQASGHDMGRKAVAPWRAFVRAMCAVASERHRSVIGISSGVLLLAAQPRLSGFHAAALKQLVRRPNVRFPSDKCLVTALVL